MNDRGPLSLYVHIPFCVRKCPYCDFVSGPVGKAVRSRYIEALRAEIEDSAQRGRSLSTLFFGGGTPTELRLAELDAIVGSIRATFAIEPDAEWSIECNPGTLTPRFLAGLRRLGFNRLSLGVQSFQDGHLASLGRIHEAHQSRQAIRQIRSAGFDNLNLDLIFALPDQTFEEWQADLEEVLSFRPEHLSLYNLTYEEGTPFHERLSRGELREIDEDEAARMYEWALDATAAAGYQQYEISNFCLPGMRCRHNQTYWANREYLGVGVSAASYVAGLRWTNGKSVEDYASAWAPAEANRCRSHQASGSERAPRFSEERLEGYAAAGEEIMLALRTSAGADLRGICRRHGVQDARYRQTAQRFAAEGLLATSDDRIRLTRRGLLLASSVCAEFLG